MTPLNGLLDHLFHLGTMLSNGTAATPRDAKLAMTVASMLAVSQTLQESASGPTDPLSPAEVLRQLKIGNRNFAENPTRPENRGHVSLDKALRPVQPMAVVIGCADSRVPPEIIFDQGIGDLFVIRVAGNVCSPHVAGSAEFAIGVLNAPLIVVLGHTQCAAVTAAAMLTDTETNMQTIVRDIRPAVTTVQRSQPALEGAELITASIEANVRHTSQKLIAISPLIEQMVSSGRVAMVGAVYDVLTGKVAWLENAQ